MNGKESEIWKGLVTCSVSLNYCKWYSQILNFYLLISLSLLLCFLWADTKWREKCQERNLMLWLFWRGIFLLGKFVFPYDWQQICFCNLRKSAPILAYPPAQNVLPLPRRWPQWMREVVSSIFQFLPAWDLLRLSGLFRLFAFPEKNLSYHLNAPDLSVLAFETSVFFWDAWLAQSVKCVILDLEIVNLNPVCGGEFT